MQSNKSSKSKINETNNYKKKKSEKLDRQLKALLSEPMFLLKENNNGATPEEFIQWAAAAGFQYIIYMAQFQNGDDLKLSLDRRSLCACTAEQFIDISMEACTLQNCIYGIKKIGREQAFGMEMN
jgi:hypothetical protein